MFPQTPHIECVALLERDDAHRAGLHRRPPPEAVFDYPPTRDLAGAATGARRESSRTAMPAARRAAVRGGGRMGAARRRQSSTCTGSTGARRVHRTRRPARRVGGTWTFTLDGDRHAGAVVAERELRGLTASRPGRTPQARPPARRLAGTSAEPRGRQEATVDRVGAPRDRPAFAEAHVTEIAERLDVDRVADRRAPAASAPVELSSARRSCIAPPPMHRRHERHRTPATTGRSPPARAARLSARRGLRPSAAGRRGAHARDFARRRSGAIVVLRASRSCRTLVRAHASADG